MRHEPTEAMVRAADQRRNEEARTDLVIEAAFAAAPPEWLLRAALTEEELGIFERVGFDAEWANPDEAARSLNAKLSRALRGGA